MIGKAKELAPPSKNSRYRNCWPKRLAFVPLAFLALLAACGSGKQQNPLVAEYDVNAPAGSTVKVEFGIDTNYGRETWSQPAPSGGGIVKIQVAGMKPITTYHMRAVITKPDGTISYDADRKFATGSFDGGRMPTFTATGDESSGRGVELINFPTLIWGNTKHQDYQAVVTDLAGNVIWYYDHDQSEGNVFPIKQLPNGHMLLNITNTVQTSVLREIDLAGNSLSQITGDRLNQELDVFGYHHHIKVFHHDFLRLPNGHTILLASEDRQLSNLVGLSKPTLVEGDDVVDLDQNLKPVWVWSTFDHLDPNRHPLAPYPDWTHGNALVYTPDHNLLLSLRNQSWIIKIDYEDAIGNGDILWKLGYQGDFTLTSGDSSNWFYGQHAPHLLSSNGSTLTLAIFDDGNDRVASNGSSCASDCYSRPIIMDVDETAKTATVEFSDHLDLFTIWGGDVRQLGSGNVEFDISAPSGLPGSRVEEITDTSFPRVVWQMDMSLADAYRAYRIPSLYPGVQW